MIKILLVDDDFLVRTFLSRLTNWNAHGYSVVGAAQDGEQALEMTQEYQPDIIITDISMPVMDGITLIRRLKKENNPAKIVVLSCHDDFEYVREAMKLGADEYVLKNLLTEQSMLKLLGELEKDVVQPLGQYDPEEARAFCENIAAYMERRDGNAIRASYAQALEAFASQHTQSHLVREWMMQAQRSAGLSAQEAPQHFSELEGREQEFLAFCEELLPDLSQYSEPVAQTIRFIQKNYGENISLNDASEAVHLNAAYLSFVFHKETEITFSEYLTACRINRAKELLLQTDEKVKEIGRQAGYRDNRHFCKMFKRVTGMTPQEYRKLNV